MTRPPQPHEQEAVDTAVRAPGDASADPEEARIESARRRARLISAEARRRAHVWEHRNAEEPVREGSPRASRSRA